MNNETENGIRLLLEKIKFGIELELHCVMHYKKAKFGHF